MSKVKGIVDSVTGGKQAAKAARLGAEAQERGGRESIAFQRESRDIARADLDPFKKAGESALPGLQDLVNDPSKQLDFVQNNPFFEALSNQASETLLSNQATTGKLGSGGTAEALQNSLLLLGTNLVDQSIQQRSGLASLGANAAAGQANISQQTGQSVGNTLQGIGNAQAAGIIGGRNAINQGRGDLMKAAAGAFGGGPADGGPAGGASAVAACDIRLKTDIQKVGKLDNGLPLYMFRYKDDPTNKIYINVMAQDVEKVNPDAVQEIDGFKHVNMKKVCH